MKLSSLSVFFPAFNDEKTIPRLIKKTARLLPKLTSDFEIIIINDGSKDNTAAGLAKLQKQMPFLRIVTHPVNKGYGAALKSGFKNARHDFIFYTDGDGQYDVTEIKKLVAKMKDGVDMVNGYKINRADNFLRKICGDSYSWLTKIVFGLKIKDVDCDFRLLRRRVLAKIKLEKNSGAICLELVKKIQDAGFKIVEVPVHHYPRTCGHSTFFNPRNILRTFREDADLFLKIFGPQKQKD